MTTQNVAKPKSILHSSVKQIPMATELSLPVPNGGFKKCCIILAFLILLSNGVGNSALSTYSFIVGAISFSKNVLSSYLNFSSSEVKKVDVKLKYSTDELT